MTIMCVTQEMGLAKSVADIDLVHGTGEVVEMNKPSELFANRKSDRTKLFLSQILQHRVGGEEDGPPPRAGRCVSVKSPDPIGLRHKES